MYVELIVNYTCNTHLSYLYLWYNNNIVHKNHCCEGQETENNCIFMITR